MLFWEGISVSSENVQIVCSSSVLSENGSVIALTGRKRVYGSITIISECCVPWLGVEATPEVDTLPRTPNYVHLARNFFNPHLKVILSFGPSSELRNERSLRELSQKRPVGGTV